MNFTEREADTTLPTCDPIVIGREVRGLAEVVLGENGEVGDAGGPGVANSAAFAQSPQV